MFDACNISPGPGLVKHGKNTKEIGRKPGTKRQNGENPANCSHLQFYSGLTPTTM
jgi:hypothetical protein